MGFKNKQNNHSKIYASIDINNLDIEVKGHGHYDCVEGEFRGIYQHDFTFKGKNHPKLVIVLYDETLDSEIHFQVGRYSFNSVTLLNYILTFIDKDAKSLEINTFVKDDYLQIYCKADENNITKKYTAEVMKQKKVFGKDKTSEALQKFVDYAISTIESKYQYEIADVKNEEVSENDDVPF